MATANLPDETQIEDLLDDIIMLETKQVDLGREEGRKRGEKISQLKSYVGGLKDGSYLASEVGFYNGVCQSLLEQKNNLETKVSAKMWSRVETIVNLAKRADELIEMGDLEVSSVIEEMKIHFKLICSAFKLPVSYQNTVI